MAIERGIDSLWSEFKQSGARTLRNQLIIYYTPFVKYVASRVLAGMPRHFDEDDLVSYGIIGLIDAIERFEPDRNLRFETYAIPRIKGAIIDELRAIDWVPRSVRTKARAIEHAVTHLESTLRRTPTDSERRSDPTASAASAPAFSAAETTSSRSPNSSMGRIWPTRP